MCLQMLPNCTYVLLLAVCGQVVSSFTFVANVNGIVVGSVVVYRQLVYGPPPIFITRDAVLTSSSSSSILLHLYTGRVCPNLIDLHRLHRYGTLGFAIHSHADVLPLCAVKLSPSPLWHPNCCINTCVQQQSKHTYHKDALWCPRYSEWGVCLFIYAPSRYANVLQQYPNLIG